MMKNVFSRVIAKGGYDLTTMLERIDEYHITGKLTDADREELISQARGDAAPGMDVSGEIQRLWAAVRELEATVAGQNSEVEDGADEADVQEYVQPNGAHDAYFNGDAVRYKDKIYLCIAPEGIACVWNPDVMPDYWQVM